MALEKSITDAAPEHGAAGDAPPFDLGAWITGMSATERSVDIYGNTAVFGRYESLLREEEILRGVQEAGESSVEDSARLGEIHREMEALYEEQQNSKLTWYVQALDSAVIRENSKEHPVPASLPRPVEPSKNSPATIKAKYTREMKAWERDFPVHEEERKEAMDARNLALISLALVRIEDRRGNVVATEVTVDQLREMQRRPHGAMQTGLLLTATLQAKAGEPVIPVPFSQSTSGSDRG